MVSFGSFFEGQEKSRVASDLDKTAAILENEISIGKISDYTMTFSGGTIGYITEKNTLGKDAEHTITMTYDFDTNIGSLSRSVATKPWTIDLAVENKLYKTYLTNDAMQAFSLPDSKMGHDSFTIKSRVNGENTNAYIISFFSARKTTGEPVKLVTTSPTPYIRSNRLGTLTASGGTLTFEQASKRFDIDFH